MQNNPEFQEVSENPELNHFIEIVREKIKAVDEYGQQHTTQYFDCAEDLKAAFEGKKEAWVYSRLTNPTIEKLEEVISTLEKTDKTAVFATGLAAIHAAITQFTKPGDKIAVIGAIYGGTYAQMEDVENETGREFIYISQSDFLEKGLPEGVKMVFFEACNNPTLRVMPIKKIVESAKEIGAKTVCDNTFTTLSIQPSQHGVDFVVHSMTKYMDGRSEDLGGCISGKTEDIDQLKDLKHGKRMIEGANMAPYTAVRKIKNMKDLPERLFKSTQNAQKVKEVASKFELKPRTIDYYEEQYEEIRNPEIPKSIQNGMVTLYFDTPEKAREFSNEMVKEDMGKCAVSLGSTTTYYCIPAETTHSEMPEEEQDRVGITSGLLRMSCGTEENLAETVEKVLARMM